ncbi:nuclear transport factor 2 family protein [Lentzea sp. BCCO 10_0856]|uniref:Nuclear transport factor 2 family protein n=1 Tax=Lentzea miocenica TaxID=3095431 RepID=A0ABU4SVZ4_9PSEU|nr:nuclear transport factor 2 family protein [Lentzea sp. BCCO 10_0856]MDX8030080.1 nuclear transport factor 2 family protein [Lentzea sp. BCCO 10_0856]
MTTPLTVATTYFDALEAGDFATVAAQFAADVVWHQPGANQFSGTHHGPEAVGAMIGGMMTVSEGTFTLRRNAPLMVNGSTVAAPVHWTAKRSGAEMDGVGVDLMRVADGKVAEVWLFTADPAQEDAFWGKA